MKCALLSALLLLCSSCGHHHTEPPPDDSTEPAMAPYIEPVYAPLPPSAPG